MTSDIDRWASGRNKDWRALIRTRANVLVTGPKATLDAFVEACGGELRRPLTLASPAGSLALPRSSTVVISDVHLLDAAAQRMLAAWMQDPENSDTQIISL